MSFRSVSPAGQNIGVSFSAADVLFFFGNRRGTRPALATAFPALRFVDVKQVHGTKIVSADPTSTEEADGLVTSSPNLACLIQTADCLPILLSNGTEVAAVHAGWRGLADPILKNLRMKNVSLACVGPHIGSASFEVRDDVAGVFRKRYPEAILPHPVPGRFFVDLYQIASRQLAEFFPGVRILSAEIDTFDSPDHQSFRRDHGPGRNLSFAALVPAPGPCASEWLE